MRSNLSLRITPIWLTLILATVMSWEFGHGFGFGAHFNYGTVAVLVIAFIKVRFVFLDFMELRTAPWPLRLTFEAWSLVVCGTLIGLYWPGY